MSEEHLKAELERLRMENEALKKGASSSVRMKVSEKGALSGFERGVVDRRDCALWPGKDGNAVRRGFRPNRYRRADSRLKRVGKKRDRDPHDGCPNGRCRRDLAVCRGIGEGQQSTPYGPPA